MTQATALLTERIEQKLGLLAQLRDLGLHQAALIDAGDMTQLLKLLAARHAVPVAIELLSLLKGEVGRQEEGLGDVLRPLRRQALHDGYPMVLSIVAYGDADWTVAS